ncbi:MAG TPA: hypothetical protein VN673_14395 [Clostridia bacterium]|nr:hypothetical protein [Clostridia bacterium]
MTCQTAPSSPEERIQLIQESLRTFVCGLLALIPVLGIIPAIQAVAGWRSASSRSKATWNPAACYLKTGGLLGVLGIALSLIPLGILAIAIALGLSELEL